MKKILFLLITLITFSLIFSFALVKAKNEENENENEKVEIKYKPPKAELKLPKLSEKQLGPFKELDDFVVEKIAEHPSANFFMLTSSGQAVQQGIVEQNQDNILTINSQGFKMNWFVATDTKVFFASSTSDIATGTRVKVFGKWDGTELNAQKIVALERKVKDEIENLIQKLKEALQKAGINIDLTPFLQQLQR
jgi:hypothetical protein